ncbi:general secretion pathway protein GspB [Neptunicella sp. SCSIO 80796]|uniref:general secretion pathway protein GspB n=1 Tax=Neptunicella plasticusilytica TaxID=3117012 RepID=UPI003A4DB7BD
MARIDINQLKPGMVIVQIVAQNGPVKIRKSGLVSSQEMVLGLMEMGVQQVEIDPAQTVELDTPKPGQSPMQSLLMKSNQQARSNVDNNLSEQFNRSLFLPSIAGLPSAWRYYGQRLLMVMIVSAGGAGLGWTAATMNHWLSAFNQPAPIAPTATEVSTSAANNVKAKAPPAVAAEQPPQSLQQVDAPVPELNTADDNRLQIADKPAEAPINQISPELLKKFNQAVAELGDSVDSTAAQIPPAEKVDVPRVDQLPRWALDELPKMSFSAHMYASEPQDRWVTLNGVELHEGEWINSNLQLQEITPQKVIMNYKGQQFSMNALTDW